MATPKDAPPLSTISESAKTAYKNGDTHTIRNRVKKQASQEPSASKSPSPLPSPSYNSNSTTSSHSGQMNHSRKQQTVPHFKRREKTGTADAVRQRRLSSLTSRESEGRLQDRSWALPLLLICVVVFCYGVYPYEENILQHFVFLSYRIPSTSSLTKHAAAGPDNALRESQYGKGRWDITFVLFYTLVITLLREFTMHEIFGPLGHRLGIPRPGLLSSSSARKQKAAATRTIARFKEQSYTALYTLLSTIFGLYVMHSTPGLWYFSTRGMYASDHHNNDIYPHTTHTAAFKAFYLIQAAFWTQQAVVVMALGQEEKRKDFKELLAHHVVTVLLIGLSWWAHFGRMGVGVYVSHDASDCLLAVSFNSFFLLPSLLVSPLSSKCRYFIIILILCSASLSVKRTGQHKLVELQI